MYHWKCLEKIAAGHHKCDLTCVVDADEENNKSATAIDRLYDSLFRLSDGLKSSEAAFADPEGGFEKLTALVDNIIGVVKEADTKVANDFLKESILLENVRQLLFDDQQLRLQTSVYLQLDIIGQKAVLEAASFLWDKLLQCLHRIRDVGADGPSAVLLKIVSTGSQTLKAVTRLYLLQSPAFHTLETLERFSQSDPAAYLEFDVDAALRTRNKKLRPDLFDEATGAPSAGNPCSMCIEDDDMEVVSGKVNDQANDDFLTFPGKFNGKPIKPLIDTGGGCNLIKLEWLQEQGIEVDFDSPRFQSLLMADGSTSQKCPCIDVKWSFDGRKKLWTDVEFVVVKGYKYNALIGLPFLKHTETIHNSAGRLVFPEFKGVHTKKGAIPMYNFEVKAST